MQKQGSEVLFFFFLTTHPFLSSFQILVKYFKIKDISF